MKPRHPNLEEMDRHFDGLPVREGCLFCDWEWWGSALEGREQYLRHRTLAHPEIKPARRRPGRHLKSFRQMRLKDEDVADILAERNKRARLLGIAID